MNADYVWVFPDMPYSHSFFLIVVVVIRFCGTGGEAYGVCNKDADGGV